MAAAHLGPQGRPRAIGPNLGPAFEGSRPGGPDLMARPPRAEDRRAGPAPAAQGRPSSSGRSSGAQGRAAVQLGGRRAQDRAA